MDKMKNSGMSETMQTLMRKSACVMLSLLLLLSAVLPVKAAAETAPAKVVRVGSFEDTFNYVNEKGARKGYGYELLETLSGYTGWQFEYVTCDWSDCFEKLENGEIDIMGDISYTDDRAGEMLFSDEPMGVEKYYLYADLSRADISASDFKTLNGKKIGVLMGTEPEVMLTEWEEKYGLKTEHVNVSNNEDAKQKLANHEIDCFVSLEESFWADLGISTITRVGKSGIYYALNKNRSDLKEELDNAMRALDEAAPFYTADLYKRYFSLDYIPILTGEEKAWLKEHGAIRMGFLTSDRGVSTYDPATGEFTGVITDYIQFAADCLGNQELEFQLVGYDSKEAELDALRSGEIDMIFHCDQNPNLAEEYHFARTNTTWITNLMAVTNKQYASSAEMLESATGRQFGVVMILMSVGMLSGFLILLPFGKKLCKSVDRSAAESGGSTWKNVLSGVFMLVMFSVYIPILLFTDNVQAAVMITGLVIAIGVGVLAKRPGLAWLNNFVMAFSMLGGLVSSLAWVRIFG